MKLLNRTLLPSLLCRCQQILEDSGTGVSRQQTNRTAASSSRETYGNAHFYILLVMLFYSFLAMTLFKCFIGSEEEEKDPYEEFMNTGQQSTQRFNTGHMAERVHFEDESSL